MAKQKIPYTILSEDEDWLILNKSANLLVIPDRYDTTIPNLKDLLTQKYGDIWVVHRLDRETSGVMVFAKSEDTHKILNQQFQDRTVEKKYWALVKSGPSESEGVIDKPIGSHPNQKGKMCVKTKGKPSFSSFKVLERFSIYTLLEVSIKTGRTHQIRVHLPSVGLPLAVDFLYGTPSPLKLSDFKRKYQSNRKEEERPLLNRTSLHARMLSLKHPITGELHTFIADLPKDLSVTLKQLRKFGI